MAEKIKSFEIDNPWLTDYSVFMAVKEEENMNPWWEWNDRHIHYFDCIKDVYSYEKISGILEICAIYFLHSMDWD